MKTDTKIIITLERNMNKLFESNKKLAAIPDNPDALIQIYDRPYISYQEINLTKSADIYFNSFPTIIKIEKSYIQTTIFFIYFQKQTIVCMKLNSIYFIFISIGQK